ncbi:MULTISPECIES: DM13 domain-containing protein [Paenibacillus]|uniref:DM13 domain-containing protein n=1 Tax=Paenibacillus TaxID=44249 RepID=UPI00211B437B|nr:MULTISPECIES: DM13 domain-containing protein [Paenibacillus]
MKKFLSTGISLMVATVVMAGCGMQDTPAESNKQASTATEMPQSITTEMPVMKTGMLSGDGKEISEGKVEIKDGKIMLSDFKTSKGPDLHIYLTKGKDVTMGKSLGKIDLKQTEQSFDLTGVDPAEYDTVLIYCDKAHVIFGSASLS